MELPPELERDIFELAAVTARRNIPLLMTVSRQVKAWYIYFESKH